MATTEPVKRKTLNRATIVAAALARADAEGLEAVTFRRLAADLGVTPMALYRHVANKAELLGAAADLAFAELELPGGLVGSWQEQLRALAHAFRRVLIAHPGIAHNQWGEVGGMSVGGLAVVEIVLGVLCGAGFSLREAAVLEAELERFVVALVVLEIEGARSEGDESRQSRRRENRARIAALPPERFARVIEAGDWLCNDPAPRWAFDVALDLLIGGLEKLLEDPHRRSLQWSAPA